MSHSPQAGSTKIALLCKHGGNHGSVNNHRSTVSDTECVCVGGGGGGGGGGEWGVLGFKVFPPTPIWAVLLPKPCSRPFKVRGMGPE